MTHDAREPRASGAVLPREVEGQPSTLYIGSDGLRLRANMFPSEAFVGNDQSGIEMKITVAPDGGLLFTTDAEVELIQSDGTSMWRVKRPAD